MEKLPPIEKIYEAWTAIADNRVSLHEGYAIVQSSDGSKSYTVKFSGNVYSSSDNGTFWRGYAGYPVIAVMMLQGVLPYDSEEASLWKDINWNALNKKYRNDYAKAVAEIEAQRHIDSSRSATEAQRILDKLASLPIEIRRKI